MNRKGEFGIHEVVALTSMAIISKILYTSVSTSVKALGTSAWLMTIISCITTIIFFLFICKLVERFPEKNIIEIYKIVFGKAWGIIIGVIFSAFLVFYCSSSTREFLEMIKSYNLPDTPPSIIIGIFIMVIALICYKGLEDLARFSYIIFYPILIGVCFILILASPYYTVYYIKPYFGYGLWKTVYTGFLRSSAYQEVTLLYIITKSIHGIKDFKKCGLITLILSGFFFGGTVLCYTMALGYEVGAEPVSGLFQLSRIIYYNRYFQEIESVFLFIWVLAAMQNCSLALYLAIKVYCETFKIKEYRNLILPFCFLTFMGTLIPNNFPQVIDINMSIIRKYSFPLPFILPIIALIISIALKKGGEKDDA